MIAEICSSSQFVVKTTSATPPKMGWHPFWAVAEEPLATEQPPSKKNWKTQLDKGFRISCNSFTHLRLRESQMPDNVPL